jgi:hypothetical protein
MSKAERDKIRNMKGWYCIPPPDAEQELREIGHGYVYRFLLASCAGIVLQWGTAGAAIFAVYKTPTVGLGCRSLTWLVYAGASTVIWMFFVSSSFLTSYARRDIGGTNLGGRNRKRRKFARFMSNFFSAVAKVFAVLNFLLVLATSLAHFGKAYKRCYCNCSVLGLGSAAAYQTFWVLNAGPIKMIWIIGVVTGVLITGLFLCFLVLVSKGELQR